MKMPSAAVPLRPIIGNKTFEGKFQMLKFYFNGSPKPDQGCACSGGGRHGLRAGRRRHPQGRPVQPEYLAVNPNAKVPAIDDGGIKVFDSNAILLYLAEKTGKFLPPNTPANRAELLSWLMFVATGVGPY